MGNPDSLQGLRTSGDEEDKELKTLFKIIQRGSPRVFPDPEKKSSLSFSLDTLREENKA